MFRRIRNGWELTKKSWAVLKGNWSEYRLYCFPETRSSGLVGMTHQRWI